MDYQEEQNSEIEALESIYEGDIKGNSGNNKSLQLFLIWYLE